LLTTSTSEAYSYCLKLIADAGDSILIPQPSYPLLQFLIEAEGLQAIPYPIHSAYGQWILDRDYLVKACNQKTRAIVIVLPNNPTGHFLSQDDLLWLAELTRERMWLISDEVFADYCWQPYPSQSKSITHLNLQNTFSLSGLSKICALPQMKLGWIVMPNDPVIHKNLELVADTYLSVSSPIQIAAVKWLANRNQFQSPVRRRCVESLDLISVKLKGSPWTLLPVQAGWSAILKGPSRIESEEDFIINLLDRGFSAHPGFYYDLPFQPGIVLSLLTRSTDLTEGLNAILSV